MNFNNNRISVEGKYKKDYLNIWKDAPDVLNCKNNGFDILDQLYSNSFLFVGINPAIDERENKVHGEIRKEYPFFKAIRIFSDDSGINNNYSVLDILAIRCTNLSDVKSAIKDDKFKRFCIKQFELFKKIIQDAKPRAIIVINAYAREWMINRNFNEKAFDTEFDEELGTRRIVNDELDGVPIFLSGMLNGRHAMDIGSRNRLVWQIKRAIKMNLI